ncbi:hypothetical protein C8Q76DRAFT_585937, partial [Earliella scabrosa]
FYHKGQLRFKAQVNQHDVGYVLGHTITQPNNTLSTSTACEEDITLWHQHCSHANLDDLRVAICKGLVSGLTICSKCQP